MIVMDFIKMIVELILYLYMLAIVLGAVLSWVNPNPANPVVRFIHNITEPVLSRVRQMLPVSYAGMDFSPIIVLLGIYFLRSLLSGGLVRSLGSLILLILDTFMLIILVRAILSWVSADPLNPLVRVIHSITEPVLRRIRQTIPLVYAGMDFSPLVVLLGLYILKKILWTSFSILM